MPARNGPQPPARVAALAADRAAYREAARRSRTGVPAQGGGVSVLATGEEERRARFDAVWEAGELFALGAAFSDTGVNPAANEIVCELLREKIRATVHDPDTAAALCPSSYPYGTKRPCLDSGYFETFNRPNVRLVDLRRTPILTVTETGIDTTEASFEFDVIVYATGFDAMTGPITAVDFRGRAGVGLREQWAAGPTTYLGLMSAGFPNLFLLTGPGSPSVLSNMVVSIEQHVDWVVDCLGDLRGRGYEVIEPTPAAQTGWARHVQDCADITLFSRAASWYMGANVPGKPRVFLPYVGGLDAYQEACEEVVAQEYLGFVRSGPAGTACHDGVVRRLQPDVFAVVRAIAALDAPRLETLCLADARAAAAAGALVRPPGPEVGAVFDGVLPGAADELRYRVYAPAGSGAHPVVLYFHGGGFVLGAHDADDPLCRDLCARSGALIVSVDYRHAPEARFPSATEDAWAALRWVAGNVGTLGGDARRLVVAGWSAGANLATTVCRMARDADGPPVCGQLLLMPLTDCRLSGASMVENAEGYLLTASMLRWFMDQSVDPADRDDPRASPLLATDLAGLPPAVVVTAEFDPLRDQGAAYAEALAAAGVPTRHLAARGHIHTSPWMVDLVLSGASVRAEVAEALTGLLAVSSWSATWSSR
jgi:acetyl esterase/lipase